jgi:hypothetical protein
VVSPLPIRVEPSRPRIAVVRWSTLTGGVRYHLLHTRNAYLAHERAKTELKTLMPEDAKEAFGHGVCGKRSKSGAVRFEFFETEASHAALG